MVLISDFPIDLQVIRFTEENTRNNQDSFKIKSTWEHFCDIFKSKENKIPISVYTALNDHPCIFWNGRILESMPGQFDVRYCPNDISREDVIAFMATYKCTSERNTYV